MQEHLFVEVGRYLVAPSAVGSAHWEDDRLFVHLLGGRFLQFCKRDGDQLWEILRGYVFEGRKDVGPLS